MSKKVLFLSQVVQNCLKEMRGTFRDREAIFFTMLFPVMMLVLMGSIFGGANIQTTSSFRIGVLNLDYTPTDVNGTIMENGTLGDTFRDVLIGANFTVYNYTQYGDRNSNGSAFYDLSRGRIQAIVIIPSNFTECLTFQYTQLLANGSISAIPISPVIEIEIDPTDKMSAQILKQVLRGVVSAFSGEYQKQFISMSEQMNPEDAIFMEFLATPVDSVTSEADVAVIELTWISYMVPGILGIVIIWAGFANSSRSLAREKENGTLKRLVISQASPSAYLVGSYLANLILVMLSAAIALVTGALLFGVVLNWDVVAFALLTLIVSMSAIGPGLIISGLARTEASAGSIQVMIAIPLQFFVGGFMPISILPPAVQGFANALPYTKYSLAIQDIAIKGLGLLDLMDSIIYMTVVGIVLMILGILVYARVLKSV